MDVKEGLQYVLDHPLKYIYFYAKAGIEPYIRLYYWNGKGNSPFHISAPVQGAYPYLITIIQRKDSPYRDKITQKTLEIDAAGLTHKFNADMDDLLAKLSRVKEDVNSKEESTMFGFHSLCAVFALLSVILVLAIASFVIEFYFPHFEIQ